MQRTALVLAPHPDDAAFSVGGLLHRRVFAPVTIVTVFGRTSFLGVHGFQADAGEATSIRRVEDAAFAAAVGAELISCELPDASVRLGSSLDVIFGDADAGSAELPEMLADVVRQVRPAVILAPAAIGGHVDHRIVRALAPGLARACGAALAYYEDLPYAGWTAAGEIASHLSSIPGNLQPLDIELNDAMEMKLASIMLYRTQATPEWVASLRARALCLHPAGAERLWASADVRDQLRSMMRRP